MAKQDDFNLVKDLVRKNNVYLIELKEKFQKVTELLFEQIL